MDTTTRVNINDLVLPVNIDPIKIGDVITFDSDSKIQVTTIGGQEFYALVQTGEFESSAINIPSVKATAAQLNPTHADLQIKYPDGVKSGMKKALSLDVTCPISNVGASFEYSASNIDPAIESIYDIETKTFKFTMNLNLDIPGADVKDIIFRDVKIRAPKGLDCKPSIGSYDSETGMWTIPEFDTNGMHTAISLTTSGIDMITANAPVKQDHSLTFAGDLLIESASAEVKANFDELIDTADFTITYDMDDFEATSVTGDLSYSIDGVSIEPVTLDNLPDFLTGDKSDIKLANPQIYLQINNPVADYDVSFDAGLLIETERNGVANVEFRPEKDIEVGHNHGSGPYNFLLGTDWESRTVPTDQVDYSQNLSFIPFPTLGNILTTPDSYSVKGLPNKIDIALENPRIPLQKVNKFNLAPIAGVKGSYTVVAPLALQDGSYIYYSDRRDGWNEDGDLDDMVITKLELSADADNNCPVDIQLKVYPIDNNNKRIESAVITSNVIKANTSGPVLIALEGEIAGLDGVEFEAVLTGGSSQTPLAPSETLELKNIKATISGYYQTDF
jgi:hypothetical protein